MSKILYKGIEKGEHIFQALIGLPEPPTDMQTNEQYYGVMMDEYQQQVEAIKANAPKIVNSVEDLAIIGIEVKGLLAIKPGDIFDPPSGYNIVVASDGYTGKETKRWATIVKSSKPEPEESQKELAAEIATIAVKHSTEGMYTVDFQEDLVEHFTISRKSPK